jgi:hypothetical protein
MKSVVVAALLFDSGVFEQQPPKAQETIDVNVRNVRLGV